VEAKEGWPGVSESSGSCCSSGGLPWDAPAVGWPCRGVALPWGGPAVGCSCRRACSSDRGARESCGALQGPGAPPAMGWEMRREGLLRFNAGAMHLIRAG